MQTQAMPTQAMPIQLAPIRPMASMATAGSRSRHGSRGISDKPRPRRRPAATSDLQYRAQGPLKFKRV
jgi:hypothetical protein